MTVYEDIVLADGPSAYYPMQETSGTFVDDITAGNRNGTISGSVTPGGVGPGTIGHKGFTFANGLVQLPSASVTGGLMIWEFWAKPNVSNVIGIFDSAPGSISTVRNYAAGIFGWHELPEAAVSLTVGVWQHVVVRYSSSSNVRRTCWYKNGVLQPSTNTANGGAPAVTTPRFGGINNGGAGWYSGMLSHCAIYTAGSFGGHTAATAHTDADFISRLANHYANIDTMPNIWTDEGANSPMVMG